MNESNRVKQKTINEKESLKYRTTYLKWIKLIYIAGKKKPFNLFGKSGKH